MVLSGLGDAVSLSPAESRGGRLASSSAACLSPSSRPRLGLWFGSRVRHRVLRSKTGGFSRAGAVTCAALGPCPVRRRPPSVCAQRLLPAALRDAVAHGRPREIGRCLGHRVGSTERGPVPTAGRLHTAFQKAGVGGQAAQDAASEGQRPSIKTPQRPGHCRTPSRGRGMGSGRKRCV